MLDAGVVEVALVGDSFVEAEGSPLVAALAEASPRLELRALGRRGYTLRRHLGRADELRAELGRARFVLACHFGGNDTLVTVEDVRALDALYRDEGRVVLWLAPPLWPARTPVTGRRDTMRRVLARAGVRVVGMGARLSAEDLAGDGVHVTRAGARRWVAQLRGEVERLGRVEPSALPLAALAALALFL